MTEQDIELKMCKRLVERQLESMELLLHNLKDVNKIAHLQLMGIEDIEQAIVNTQESLEDVIEISKGVWAVAERRDSDRD